MTNAKGIDVSSYQAETPPLAGLSFLIARASIGSGKDARYAHHIANAKAAHLVTGAYHFNDNGTSSTAQADLFLNAAGEVDLYFIDVEGQAAFSQNQTRAFIDRVHSKGKRCGLYHSASGYFTVNQDYDWVAKWSPTAPTRHWDFWQYRGSPLDLDQFHGTAAQLRAFVGVPPAPPSDVDPVGLKFRFVDRKPGTVKVSGSGHALITVDNMTFVAIPADQVREVAGRVKLLAEVPGHIPAGAEAYLVGNVPGLLPDGSEAAILLVQDGTFTAGSADVKHTVTLLLDNQAAYNGEV